MEEALYQAAERKKVLEAANVQIYETGDRHKAF